MRFIKIISLLILSVYCNSILAQSDNDNFVDIRIKNMLDSNNVNYMITKMGNFRINLITEEAPIKRTQLVYIYSKKEQFGDFKILNIESVGFRIAKKDVKEALYLDILKKNAQLKLGSWGIYEYDDYPEYYFFVFNIKTRSNISADELHILFNFAGTEADEKEKIWRNGIDLN